MCLLYSRLKIFADCTFSPRFMQYKFKDGYDINREDVAAAVCMNTDYFAKLFKKKNGLLISEYILKCRMELAQELLKTNMPVVNVAMEAGFNSSTYFSTTFKKYFGKSPQEYRKEAGML